MYTKSLIHVLSDHAETIGNKHAYHYYAPRDTDPLSITYGELNDYTCMLSTVLKRLGLKGKNVLLMYPSGLEFIKVFYSCMRGNISAVPMYIPPGSIPDTRLRAMTTTVDIAAVLTIKANYDQVNEQINTLYPDRKCPVICTDDLALDRVCDRELSIDYSQPPLIQFTSGSTSNPKGVIVSHANIMANQLMMKRGFHKHMKSWDAETMVSWLPFFHDMGLICGLMHPLYIGGTAVLMSPTDFLLNPIKWLHLISKHSATISGAPNFAYDYCVSRIQDDQLRELNLSSWKVAYNGSEMIRPTTLKRFTERFGNCGLPSNSMFNCYGMAETTLFVSGETAIVEDDESIQKVVGVGNPDEESEVIIVSEDKLKLGEGNIGEIWVRGPHVAQGYINNPEATEETFRAKPEGDTLGPTYLRTGDLGYLHNGKLHISGRLKNLIVVNGKNYYGEEIEYFVSRSHIEFVESGACILQINEGLTNGEVVFIQEIDKHNLVSVKNNLQELEEKAIQLSREIINEFKLTIHRFIFLGHSRLPRTSSGKIDRSGAFELVSKDDQSWLLEVATR